MTALGLTARTKVHDLGRFAPVEQGITRRRSGTAMTSRNEPEGSGSGEREPRFTNGAVHI